MNGGTTVVVPVGTTFGEADAGTAEDIGVARMLWTIGPKDTMPLPLSLPINIWLSIVKF